MNLTNLPNPPFLYCNFNQDHSCLSVGNAAGYRIYNCDPFGKCYSINQNSVGLVEMLFSTSLVALVGHGEHASPRRLVLVNTKRQSTICQLSFSTTITAVKLNRKRLVVLAENHIYIYDISNMKLLHSIDTIHTNMFALSPSSEASYLAYPDETNPGNVLLFDTLALEHTGILQPHKSSIAALAFNYSGTLLATASDKGTVIRVLSVPGGQILHQFRRGSYPAKICSLEFDLASTVLAVGSDTDTIHVFRLTPPPPEIVPPRYKTLLSTVASAAQNVLPSSISEMWDPQRDWCRAKIPKGTTCLVAPTTNQLLVVTDQGYFYQYSMDLTKGGECVLSKTFR